ncbi:hypothetical protein ACWDUM_03105 [Rhodococcus sp. NPDC003322]
MSHSLGLRIASTAVAAAVLAGGFAAGAGSASAAESSTDENVGSYETVTHDFVGSYEGVADDPASFLLDAVGAIPGVFVLVGSIAICSSLVDDENPYPCGGGADDNLPG